MCIGDMVWLMAYNIMVLERSIISNISPAGMVRWYAGEINTIPAGHILCDGTSYQKSAFPALFEAIGYLYLKESDVTSGLSMNCFRVPDLLGRGIVGADMGARQIDEEFDQQQWTHFNYNLGTMITPIGGTNKNGSGAYAGFDYTIKNTEKRMTHFQMIPIITTGEVCG